MYHDLRFTTLSCFLFDSDEWKNPLIIQERIGHEDIATTLGTYGHLYPNNDFEVANKLNDILSFEPTRENLDSPCKNQFTASYIRNEKIKRKRDKNFLFKDFLALLWLFPLNRWWWLAGDIIDYAVNVWHFINNSRWNLL